MLHRFAAWIGGAVVLVRGGRSVKARSASRWRARWNQRLSNFAHKIVSPRRWRSKLWKESCVA
jgi:hypothetical protein